MNRNTRLIPALLLISTPAFADHVEEVTVQGSREKVVLDRSNLTVAMPDTAELMRRIPGGGVNKNGALTGIPQYRGMYGGRVHVNVDGLAISPGGPNWMDPPLHYAPTALLENFVVFRGIAPVSAGQETIGGAIEAETWHGSFTENSDWENHGRLYTGAQSNGKGWVSAITTAVANNQHKLHIAALTESGDDQKSADATITPTEYQRQRYDLGYSLQLGNHVISLDATRNETNDSGTPALPMDILYVDGEKQKLAWSYLGSHWQMQAQLANSNIEHGMTNYHLRSAPADMSRWRRNETSSDTQSGKFSLGQNLAGLSWKAGLDVHNSIHNSDISNPNNAMFYSVNFNDISRDLMGVFAETQFTLQEGIELELGLRATQVETNADTVNTSMAMMNPMVATLRDNFNNANRKQRDDLFDAVAKIYTAISNELTFYTGIARKSRAPAYQERYLWMPMQSTAGLADGNNHVGTIDLQPEVSHELEIGFDLNRSKLMISPRLYWKNIDNYIQGVPETNPAIVMVSTNMGGDPTPLRFANTSAKIYGADMEASWQFLPQWTLGSVVTITRGERRDIDDNLYRITPDNLTLSLKYQADTWSVSLINALYRKQNKVSVTNEEQTTAGYGTLSLHSSFTLAKDLTLAVGVNNLLDKSYADHLAGYNRAANPDIAIGERLPGMGRDAFVRLKWDW
ncbi:TonB-dependent receptor [Spongiibacter sp. KMU-158]|uniref:TonB-dependent receptor n=1 Tax=Spongiibacter pelagi TaxID=2760804 RepID=A0A927GW04_9GAMM|nr:TonB-dependent receptor [Spongiibacter pelagi]MBD2858950.1 TonB-dependent receptor [Spongiibacter pelagi]